MVAFEYLSDALASLLPPPVQYNYTRSFTNDAVFTYDEEAYIARVRPKRRLEFATGRHCVLAALSALGRGAVTLGREKDGRPRWPQGIVGSVSHSDQLCVAAVAEQQVLAAIGIDVEPRIPLPEGVLELVASSQEIAALPYTAFPTLGPPPFDTVLFSAKESVFKALYPEVRRFFGFEEVSLALTADGCFEAQLQPRLAREARRGSLGGRFALTRDYVLTAVLMPSGDAKNFPREP